MPAGLRIAPVLLLLITLGGLVPPCVVDEMAHGSSPAHTADHAEEPTAPGADDDCCADCACCGLTFFAAEPAPLVAGSLTHGFHVYLATLVRPRPPWDVWHPPRI